MNEQYNDSDDPKAVSAVLKKMDELTREQWLERLTWTPEGLEHKQLRLDEELCTAITSQARNEKQAEPGKKGALALLSSPKAILTSAVLSVGAGAVALCRKRSQTR